MSGTRLRAIEASDVQRVLELNAGHLDAVSELDQDRLARLCDLADRADVVESDGRVAGFVIAFAPCTAYDSVNYREFARRYGDAFYYLDRIVIAEEFRRRGLGAYTYDALERAAAEYGRMTLEVNTVPFNSGSLAFHQARGYVEVGTLTQPHLIDGVAKQASLMVKELA